MPYATGRIFHDADAHIMETPDWLLDHADAATRARLPRLDLGAAPPAARGTDEGDDDSVIASLRRQHADPDYRARDEAELMLRKNWSATGSFIAADRPRALDLLGFASQLVFNTFSNGELCKAERAGDLALVRGMAEAHNRAMLAFCAVDRRLIPSCYVPLGDFTMAREVAAAAIRDGAGALLIASACPRGHSPSHIGLDPVWAQAEEAGIPIVFHVGGGGALLDPAYFENGLPRVTDFHGGAENFRSVDYMAIPTPVMQTLATLIIDGVLERFPRLKWGVIEQGASWLPSWMRYLDSAHAAFAKSEERLRKLSLRPSDYVRRQIRATPYPAEDVRWIMEQAGEETCLFSSDFPHVEGGRNPLGRFGATLAGAPEAMLDRFYRANFEDLVGAARVARLAA